MNSLNYGWKNLGADKTIQTTHVQFCSGCTTHCDTSVWYASVIIDISKTSQLVMANYTMSLHLIQMVTQRVYLLASVVCAWSTAIDSCLVSEPWLLMSYECRISLNLTSVKCIFIEFIDLDLPFVGLLSGLHSLWH